MIETFRYGNANQNRYDDFFACSRCLKLRPKAIFADKQVTGKRGKRHAENDRRLCLACGVSRGIYQAGHGIRIKKRAHFLCGSCWKICGSGRYCMTCRRCEKCFIGGHSHGPHGRRYPLRYLGEPEPVPASIADTLLHARLSRETAEYEEH